MYRDDLEAAIARADAAERALADAGERIATLEAELAAARLEVQRLERLVPAPAPERKPSKKPHVASPKPDREQPSDLRPWILGGLGVAGFVGLVAAMMFGARACARDRVMTGPGKLSAAHVMRAADGAERLVLVSEAIARNEDGVSLWRIDVVDPATGLRLRRRGAFGEPRDHRPELGPAGDGRMWCDLRGSFVGQRRLVELCDVETLALVVTEDALLAQQPTLRGGFAGSPQVDPGSGALIATTTTGEEILLTPDLALRPFSSSQEEVCLESQVGGGRALRATVDAVVGRPVAYHEGGGSCATPVDGRDPAFRAVPRLQGLGQTQHGLTGSVDPSAELRFDAVDGGGRRALFRGGYGSRDQVGTDTFIDPEVLADRGQDHGPMLLPDRAVIVLHQATLDRNTADVLVSLVGFDDGAARWTLTWPPGEVMLGARFGDTVVLALEVFGDAASLVIALDWKTGVERWRYPI